MAHEIKLSELPVIELELHDCEIIANAINVFGSGNHPIAQADNLDYFDLKYLLACLDKGIERTKTEAFKEEVTDLWCEIHMAMEGPDS